MFDLFQTLAEPQHLRDPYPFYRWLRAHDPVHIDPGGTAYVSRYEYVAFLREPDIRDAPEDDASSFTLATINQALIKAVPPRHTHLRRVGAAAFNRQLLSRAETRIQRDATALATMLASSLERDGTANLHDVYSLPFTQRAAATVFGIPDDDFEILAALPARMFQALYPQRTPGGVADADAASLELFNYMEEGVRSRRFVPGSGFANIVEASDQTLADDIVRLCWMLWWGSYTSALAAIDLAVITLIENPRTAERLHQDTKAWIDEALRYRSPHIINSANLTTTREMTIGPTVLAPQTSVRFLLAAINRDDEAFPEADTFDPYRNRPARHVAFGEGIHACIGAQLARMEIAVALKTLSTCLPRLTLAAEPTWRTYTTQRLCSVLPVMTA